MEEMFDSKAIYIVNWLLDGYMKGSINYIEVIFNTTTGSIMTLVHPDTSSIKEILTNQIAISVTVTISDKCGNFYYQQSGEFGTSK